MTLPVLPRELWSEIFAWTQPDPVTLGQLRGVSSDFAATADQDVFWRSFAGPAGATLPLPHTPLAHTPSRGQPSCRATFLNNVNVLQLPAPLQGPATSFRAVPCPEKGRAVARLYALAQVHNTLMPTYEHRDEDEDEAVDWSFLRWPSVAADVDPYAGGGHVVQATLQQLRYFFSGDATATYLGRDTFRAAIFEDYTLHRALLCVDPFADNRLPRSFFTDPSALRLAAAHNPRALTQGVAEALLPAMDAATWRRAALLAPDVLAHAPAALLGDATFMTEQVAHDATALAYASPALQDDATLVRQAVAKEGMALSHASERLRADAPTVFSAVLNDGDALFHASAALRSDRQVVLAAVLNWGAALRHADPALQDDQVMVAAATEQGGTALRWASARLRDNHATVAAAVARDGRALRYASDRLRADVGVVATAMQHYPQAYKWALGDARSQVQLAAQAIMAHNELFLALPPPLRQMYRLKRVLMDAVLAQGSANWPIEQILGPTHSFSLLLRAPALDLPIAPAFASDPRLAQVVLQQALTDNGLNLRFFAPSYRAQPHWANLAVAQNGLALAFVPPQVVDGALVRRAVANDGLALAYAPEALRRDGYVVEAAVENNFMALEFAAPQLREHPYFARARAAWAAGRAYLASPGYRASLNYVNVTQPEPLWPSSLRRAPERDWAWTFDQLGADEVFSPLRLMVESGTPLPFTSMHHDVLGVAEAYPPPLAQGRTAETPPDPRAWRWPRHFATALFRGEMARRFWPNGRPR